jgi:mannose-6-phosphate isomerase-like protein (cupin superfamily)
MKIANINESKARFEVLQTTSLSQTAVMTLPPGNKSSEKMNVHEKSDQVLLVIEGEVRADLAGEQRVLRNGDVCIVPAGTKHRFENLGKGAALTFNVYTPPEYAPNEKDEAALIEAQTGIDSRAGQRSL